MGFASRILIGPLLLGMLGIAPAGLDARLARLAAQAGHPAREHFVAQRTETYERRTYVDRIETQGMRRISHRCHHAVCRGSYFDGTRTFSLSYNDVAFPEDDEDNATARTLRAIDSLEFAEPAFERSGGAVSEEPAHRDALTRFRVTAPGGRALIAVIDPATSRLTAVDDADRPLIAYHDYRKVDGLWFAYERTAAGESLTYERVTRNAAPLERPHGLAIEPASPSGATIANAPVPAFHCTLAAIDFLCVLDTGTAGMAISLRAAERLHLEPEGEIDVAGLGRYVSGLVRAGPLDLPGARIHDTRFIVLPDFRAADIIVGGDALAVLRTTIDYAHRTIAFKTEATAVSQSSLPITFRNMRPYVDIELAGEHAALELDTGDDSEIDLGYAYFRTRPTLLTLETRGKTQGIGASSDRFGGTLHDVGIGPFHFDRVAGVVTRTLRERGHLGAKLLERFTVTLDYAHERMELVPRPGAIGLSQK